MGNLQTQLTSCSDSAKKEQMESEQTPGVTQPLPALRVPSSHTSVQT